jgi:hypothetical protein
MGEGYEGQEGDGGEGEDEAKESGHGGSSFVLTRDILSNMPRVNCEQSQTDRFTRRLILLMSNDHK